MKDRKKLTPQELMAEVETGKGKSTGWPNYFGYSIDSDSVRISVDNRILDKKATRRLDSWGLAFLIEAENRCGMKISNIMFEISGQIDEIKSDGRLVPNLEAFRRRVSFLSINNPALRFGITINGEAIELDDANSLFSRPANEKIHGNIDQPRPDNRPGRLEKDFQTWLFANGVTKTNERLAVLGEDFFKMKNKAMGIIREFPTGVFRENISQKTRILPTEFVDVVTFNKYGNLAVIEIKLNDSQLEVIAQILDYALFFRCYRNDLRSIIEKKPGRTPKNSDIVCYVVNNHFHDRFDEVMKYYHVKDASLGFVVKKVVLGYHEKEPNIKI